MKSGVHVQGQPHRRCLRIGDRGAPATPQMPTDDAVLTHQPRDPFAVDAHPEFAQFGVDAGCTVPAAMLCMDPADQCDGRGLLGGTLGARTAVAKCR